MLKLDLMSAKGTLNSRGLLEALLINVKVEKKLTGNFNASRTCESIELNTQHHYEKVLVDAALEVFKVYEDRDLNQNSEGVPSILYLHIYRKLSSKIHERPYHGSKVRKMICIQVICMMFNFRSQFLRNLKKTGENYLDSYSAQWVAC